MKIVCCKVQDTQGKTINPNAFRSAFKDRIPYPIQLEILKYEIMRKQNVKKTPAKHITNQFYIIISLNGIFLP